jgi:hypothetical protein
VSMPEPDTHISTRTRPAGRNGIPRRPGSAVPENSGRSARGRQRRSGLLRSALTGLLGVSAAVLVSCGSSSSGLIPAESAGPLQNDFEAVARAAQSGNGNCTATTEAINKTEQDFAALPPTINAGLHSRLSQGISNLRTRALELCTQPLAQTTTTSTPRTTTPTPTPTKTQTTTTPATTPTTTPTTPATTPTTPATPPNNGGGTAAPGSESESEAGVGESGGSGIQEGTK